MNDSFELEPSHVFWGGIILEAVLVGIAAIVGIIVFGEPFPFTLIIDSHSLWESVLATVPIIAYMLFSLSPVAELIPPLRRIYEFLKTLMGRSIAESRAWQLVLLGLAAGIGEETLFRGVLQPWMTDLTSPWTAIIITSIVFGLLHAMTPMYFVVATAISLYFGWIMLKTDNLLVPVLAHGLYDVVGFLVLRWKFRGEGLGLDRASDSDSDSDSSGP
jgi:membrane protease YdiL (CAAX protease family)